MSEPKTIAEYQLNEKIGEAVDKEREKSDRTYAVKLVEVIVFGMVTVILLAVLGAIVALVVTNAK